MAKGNTADGGGATGSVDAVKMLLTFGAMVARETYRGQTP
jgi:hypothetical protein